jgi:hypothetical protein
MVDAHNLENKQIQVFQFANPKIQMKNWQNLD